MIREENISLNQNLENASKQLDDYHSVKDEFRTQRKSLANLRDEHKKVSMQLDRERAKNRAMVKVNQHLFFS